MAWDGRTRVDAPHRRLASVELVFPSYARNIPLLMSTGPAACRSVTQTSLLAEVEAQAFCNGSPIAVAQLEIGGRKAGAIFSYERRIFGLGVGVRDGVVLLDVAPDPLSTASLMDQV